MAFCYTQPSLKIIFEYLTWDLSRRKLNIPLEAMTEIREEAKKGSNVER